MNSETVPFITDELSYGAFQITYPRITLTTDGISVGDYQRFIASLRSYLKSEAPSHDILVLRKSSKVTDRNMFVEVELFYFDKELKRRISITLAIYVLNLYVIGYKTENKSFFFKEAPNAALRLLFNGTTKIPIGLSTNYNHLPNREGIPLSKEALQTAIRTLHDFHGVDYKTIRRSVVVVLQMVAEATRFKFIQQYIEFKLIEGYTPKADTVEYENSWDPLSERIQHADSKGKFRKAIFVNHEIINYVSQVKSKISILLYKGTGGGEGEIGKIYDEQVVEDYMPWL